MQFAHGRRQRSERKEQIEFVENREQCALLQVMEMEFRTRIVLEEPSCAIVNQAIFEHNMREAKAGENLEKNLTQPLRQQVAEVKIVKSRDKRSIYPARS